MATYVPGVGSYLPDFKPFTPDYKFLSNVLDTKTNRYNTNYKAVNDLYSKVVYGDLSRGDTQAMRDQYAENLGPKLQQISGMDLSVMQNAQAAQSIFKPFFEDDLIVKDLVTTKHYKNEMGYANMLQNSPDREQREMYWTTGIQKMKYQMEDFINASQDEALNMAVPKYTPDADLYEMAMKYLKESGLEAEIDMPTPDGMWIVKKKNGDIITRQALQMVQKALKDDPRVVNAYHAQSFVTARSFAESGMQAGKFTTIDEGQRAWATEQIGRMEELIADRNKKLEDRQMKEKNIVVSWQNYEAQYGITDGSKAQQEQAEAASNFEATTEALEGNRNVLSDNKGISDESNTNQLLNRAYGLLMNYNMESDLQAAAIGYSNIGKKIGLEVNPYGKMKAQYQYDVALENLKNRNKLMQIAARKKADEEDEKDENDLKNKLALKITNNEMNTETSGAKDEDGEFNPNYNHEEDQNEKLVGYNEKVTNQEIDWALKMYQHLEADKKTGVVEIGGMKGNLQELSARLKEQYTEGDKKGQYIHQEAIDNLFGDMESKFINLKADASSFPDKSGPVFLRQNNGEDYLKALSQLSELKATRHALDYVNQGLTNAKANNLETALKLEGVFEEIDDGEGYSTLFKNGMPTMYTRDAKGNATQMTEDEYVKAFNDWARTKGKNIDIRNTPFDETGVLSSDNEEWQQDDDGNYAGVGWGQEGTKYIYPQYNGGSTVVIKYDDDTPFTFNEAKSSEYARRSYQKLKEVQNATMNGGLKSIATEADFKVYDVAQAMRGIRNMTQGDINKNQVYSVQFNAKDLTEPAVEMYSALLDQENETPSQEFYVYANKYQHNEIQEDDFVTTDEDIEILTEGGQGVSDEQRSNGKLLLRDLKMMIAENMRDKSGNASKDVANFEIKYFNTWTADSDNVTRADGDYAGYVIKPSLDFLGRYIGKGKLLEKAKIEDYMNINIVFKKEKDINPLRYGQFEFSATAAEIASSQNQVYTNNTSGGGDIYVQQNGGDNLNDYVLTYKPLALNEETGDFEYIGEEYINLGNDKNLLDAQVQQYIIGMQQLSITNKRAKDAWDLKNKNK
jgi:hypothetical protein|tara:strand:- start:7015 stop:10248 length:3234 start_codon:yes stop_codon:yes gene_type:complete